MEVGFIIVHEYGKLEDGPDQTSVTIWKTWLRLIPNINNYVTNLTNSEKPSSTSIFTEEKINSLFHRNQVEITICIRTRQHNDKWYPNRILRKD